MIYNKGYETNYYNIQGIIFSKFYINVKKIYKDLFFSMNKLIFKNKKFLPKSSNLMSFAAWIPSSFKFFSICLLRALEALSSADIAHPMMKFGVHEVKVDVAPPQMGICKKKASVNAISLSTIFEITRFWFNKIVPSSKWVHK